MDAASDLEELDLQEQQSSFFASCHGSLAQRAAWRCELIPGAAAQSTSESPTAASWWLGWYGISGSI